LSQLQFYCGREALFARFAPDSLCPVATLAGDNTHELIARAARTLGFMAHDAHFKVASAPGKQRGGEKKREFLHHENRKVALAVVRRPHAQPALRHTPPGCIARQAQINNHLIV